MPNLWPFAPLLGISETLEQLSNVLITRVTEQRLTLRQAPRQTLTYVTHLDPYKFAQAKAFAEENTTVSVYVPVWLEAVRLGGVGALDSVLEFDTTYGDWRVGSSLVIWESYDNYVVAEIADFDSSSLTLTAPVATNFHQPYVIPVRTALVKQGYQFSRKALYIRATTVFSVTDNSLLVGVSEGDTLDGYATYLGLVVLPAPPFEAAETPESIIIPTQYFDSGLGPVVGEPSRIVNDFGTMLSFLDDLGPELWSRRKFLHWIRGKAVPFWYPSYNKDLQLINDIGAADITITVRRLSDDPDYYLGKHIMILLKNGTTYFRAITGSSAGPFGDVLGIAALGSVAAMSDVNLICFLSRVRSNTDSFTFLQSTPNMVTLTMPVLEVQE